MGRKLTNEDIKERIFKLVGDEYTKLDNVYINANTKFKMRHETCGHEYSTSWHTFQQGCRCPKCAGLMKLTTEDIKERIYSLEGDNYELLSEYGGSLNKIKIKHVACDCVYEVNWNAFHQGARCPKCAGLYRYTDSEMSELISEMTNGEYTKLSKYKNNKAKFKIRHNLCNHQYMVNWASFQQGCRCPKCNQPKGEKFIEDYLTNKGISFTAQIRFSDCRYKRPLPFDFAILDDNKRVICLLEHDGKQHFQAVEYWGGEEALKIRQLRDQIKNEYCKKNGIPLLRIRYDDENIEEKLNLFINQEQKEVAN